MATITLGWLARLHLKAAERQLVFVILASFDPTYTNPHPDHLLPSQLANGYLEI